ncbi:hypothetical protein THASP1DRAFT_29473 [Thamnocephalis sphaerospora]|uniref:C2 domain-containing protein n=1 Tax=Thamnocephalis sphaerospora TaxID=78915 RepID=A0A4P9XRL7_9FUNG|nr:hypothetical protein THASP1DRAFT_29473 [Thamnocephalis sphaerospora]|eukprot:RKP08734.1 hypothetical protein THASP1DRAFT_29473 [Thamnocephalis sphaerospora]
MSLTEEPIAALAEESTAQSLPEAPADTAPAIVATSTMNTLESHRAGRPTLPPRPSPMTLPLTPIRSVSEASSGSLNRDTVEDAGAGVPADTLAPPLVNGPDTYVTGASAPPSDGYGGDESGDSDQMSRQASCLGRDTGATVQDAGANEHQYVQSASNIERSGSTRSTQSAATDIDTAIKRNNQRRHRARSSISSLLRRRLGSRVSTSQPGGSAASSTEHLALSPTAIVDRKSAMAGNDNMPVDWNDSSESVARSPSMTNGLQDNLAGKDIYTNAPGTSRFDALAAYIAPFGKLPYGIELNLDTALSHYASTMRFRYVCSIVGVVLFLTIGYSYGLSIWLAFAIIGCLLYALRRADTSDASIWTHLVELERANRILGKQAESVEWVNYVVRQLWPLINRELFAPAIDLMEKVLQAHCPGFVYAVRVDEVDQGVYPFRVRGIRVLPADLHAARADDEFNNGIHIEADFSYQAVTAATSRQQSRNAHMICLFNVGVKGVAGVVVPAFIELLTCTGTCRIKLQPSPDPPFVRMGNFTLMRRPRIDISVKPLRTVNVMNVPLISDYILHCINIVLADFIWPKSYTADIGKFILGDDVPHESPSIGVLHITFHSAANLRNADVLGKSDAYATISLSQRGKTRFRTRILANNLNPVWEETGFMLVTRDDVRNDERIHLKVWDADRWNSDDALGYVELPLLPLISSPGEIVTRTDALLNQLDDDPTRSELTYSIGFYPKTPKIREALPGILTVTIHEAIDLELRGPPREAQPEDVATSGVAGSIRRASNVYQFPSSYAELLVNDELTYRTRTKPSNPRPFWNCSTDRFIRDWHSCRIRVVVRDLRSREHDPILGVVALELAELMENIPPDHPMEVSRRFRLLGGIGLGHIRLSVVFHPVQMSIPPSLCGYNVGVLHLDNLRVTDVRGLVEATPVYCRVSLNARDSISHDTSTEKMRCKNVEPLPIPTRSSKVATSLLQEADWSSTSMTFPVRARYITAVILQLRQRNLRREVIAQGVVWLKDLVDDEPVDADIPLFALGDVKEADRDQPPNPTPVNLVTATRDCLQQSMETHPGRIERFIGHLRMTICFRRGIAADHRRRQNAELRRAMEVHELVRDENLLPGAAVDTHRENLIDELDWRQWQGSEEHHGASEASADEGDAGSTGSIYQRHSMESASLHERLDDAVNGGRYSEQLNAGHQRSASSSNLQQRKARYQLGPMKYKGVRTLKWAKDKLEEGGQRVRHIVRPRHRQNMPEDEPKI